MAAAVKTKAVAYVYDAFDRRVGKDVDDEGDGVVDRSERFVYDGGDAVLTTDAAGTVATRSLHGPLVDQLFADEDALDGVLWALADDLGSVRDVARLDPATGTASVVDHLTYDGFGQVLSETAAAFSPPAKYTGKYVDPLTGLQWNLHRWYDPGAGTWTTRDPLGFAASDPNLTRYVGNGPTNAVDPTGLFGIDLIRPEGNAPRYANMDKVWDVLAECYVARQEMNRLTRYRPSLFDRLTSCQSTLQATNRSIIDRIASLSDRLVALEHEYQALTRGSRVVVIKSFWRGEDHPATFTQALDAFPNALPPNHALEPSWSPLDFVAGGAAGGLRAGATRGAAKAGAAGVPARAAVAGGRITGYTRHGIN